YDKIIDSLKTETIRKICEFENISQNEYYSGKYLDKYSEQSGKTQTKGEYIKERPFTYGPVLQTQWHQDVPYNDSCPKRSCYTFNSRTLAGCVPIAIAQIFSYYQARPINQFVTNVPYNYDFFCHYGNIPVSGDPVATKAVSAMIYDIGVKTNTIYGCEQTATASAPAIAFMNNFVEWRSGKSQRFKGIKMNHIPLIADGLVIAFGQNSGGRHCWVIEGGN
ncbi:MAG: C10 family peptidase, partial [Puniceicoccales bacterium]|nr:C10 family peptidase [Puniceicoccales bacterium]